MSIFVGARRGPAVRHAVMVAGAALAALAVMVSGPIATPAAAQRQARSDLDDFMARVVARRDQSWRTLQQYILEERETLRIVGPGDVPVYGSRREYTWFPRDGVFVRSPVRVDGVTLDEDERRRAEQEWLEREEQRARRRGVPLSAPPSDTADASAPPDVIRQSIEPGFVSAAYFLRYRFDPGQYALVGRETFDGREVLRVEYYPTSLFRQPPRNRRGGARESDPEIARQMNKTSLVTLWIEPENHQILQYVFENVDLDFLPGRAIVRLDELHASMRMHQPFPGVWLPQWVTMRFDLMTAAGALVGNYDVAYHDYRLADVTMRIQ